MRALASLPPSVAWLGYGGLLPFLTLAAASAADVHHRLAWSEVLVAYGAVILSFVGALHWGFAMLGDGLSAAERRGCYLWSVVPALLAWPASWLGAPLACGLLIFGFVLHYLQDRRLVRLLDLPGWYLPLRRRLTAVACLALAATAWITVPIVL